MTGKEMWESEGWKVNYKYHEVSVTSPNGKEYLVCSKYYGGSNYDKELQASYRLAAMKGLVPEIEVTEPKPAEVRV